MKCHRVIINRSISCLSITGHSFQSKMFGWTGTLTPSQTAEIAATKQVIYDGFKAALQAGGAEGKGRYPGR